MTWPSGFLEVISNHIVR